MDLLLPLLAFAFASLMVTGLVWPMVVRRVAMVDRRLGEVTGRDAAAEPRPSVMGKVTDGLKRLGHQVPQSQQKVGKLRQRLVHAGLRSQEAVAIFYGIRVAAAIGAFLLLSSSLVARINLGLAIGGMGLGYLLPSMVLGRLERRRQRRIRLALADVLDLLVVSVEAGLGLDQALLRVGEELAFAYSDLSDELKLVNLELRAGKGRTEAFRHLADRTGVDDVASLVTMLVQTDRFGTSVAQSLRVYSETLRTKRRQRAEEAAAKTGVKMVFPLVFCIFPAIWVVTIGPAAIKFVNVLTPIIQQGR